jgi:hypothetical protein
VLPTSDVGSPITIRLPSTATDDDDDNDVGHSDEAKAGVSLEDAGAVNGMNEKNVVAGTVGAGGADGGDGAKATAALGADDETNPTFESGTHAVSPSGTTAGTANTTQQQTNVDTATSVAVTEVDGVDGEVFHGTEEETEDDVDYAHSALSEGEEDGEGEDGEGEDGEGEEGEEDGEEDDEGRSYDRIQGGLPLPGGAGGGGAGGGGGTGGGGGGGVARLTGGGRGPMVRSKFVDRRYVKKYVI